MASPSANCPNCKRPVEPAFRPFCSQHCANVDLAKWLTGAYAIPVEDDDEDDARPDRPQ